MRLKGFSFPEIIIYIAIAAMVLVGVVLFSWRIIGAGVRVDVSTNLTQEGRLVLERITQAIRSADAVMETSVFNTNPGILNLDFPGTADVIIDTYLVSGIRKLRMKEGANAAIDLTSNQATVTNFIVVNLRRAAEPANLRIDLTLNAAQAGQDPARNHSIALQTSASLRH